MKTILPADKVREEDRGYKSPCLIWTGTPHLKGGYGSVYLDGRSQLAHKAAYEGRYGPIPDGLSLHHMCDVKACVNPAHMALINAEAHGLLHSGRRPRKDRGPGPNPSGLCMCGCGRQTQISARNNPSSGAVEGTPLAYIRGHHLRGAERNRDDLQLKL